jgi:UDP-glucuronate 4-epimerase
MVGSGLGGRTVLVTGAAGFIGFHLTKRLLATGARVVGIDNMNSYYDVALKDARLRVLLNSPAFRFERCDVTEHEAVRSVFESCDPEFVVHFAAQAGVRYSLTNPRAHVSSNIDGFLAILEACRARPIRHLLYASSSSVYGTDSKVGLCGDETRE